MLNGNHPSSTPDSANTVDDAPDNPNSNAANPGWITKTDRHLQLINTSVFEKESQNRAKAMEETRKLKLKQRDEREKSKFNKHLQRANGSSQGSYGSSDSAGNYVVNVNDIRFRVAKNGSKLVKVPGECTNPFKLGTWFHLYHNNLGLPFSGDLNAAKATPKTAHVGGVKFYRSKNGNLFRSGIIKAQRYGWPTNCLGKGAVTLGSANISNIRRAGVIKKIDEPCRAFSTTGNPFLSKFQQETALKRRTGWGIC